jgi:hypothetical protein
MDDRPVSVDRLEVIGSGSSERLYSAMRDQAERGRDFQRRVRWMWLRRELVLRPEDGPVIDVRASMTLISTEAPEEQRQEDSA